MGKDLTSKSFAFSKAAVIEAYGIFSVYDAPVPAGVRAVGKVAADLMQEACRLINVGLIGLPLEQEARPRTASSASCTMHRRT